MCLTTGIGLTFIRALVSIRKSVNVLPSFSCKNMIICDLNWSLNTLVICIVLSESHECGFGFNFTAWVYLFTVLHIIISCWPSLHSDNHTFRNGMKELAKHFRHFPIQSFVFCHAQFYRATGSLSGRKRCSSLNSEIFWLCFPWNKGLLFVHVRILASPRVIGLTHTDFCAWRIMEPR